MKSSDHFTDEHGFAPRTAWSLTSRVTYGGGSTKDIIYLRGIERVLGYFAEGRSIDPLLAGKLSLDHAPLVEDLIRRASSNLRGRVHAGCPRRGPRSGSNTCVKACAPPTY